MRLPRPLFAALLPALVACGSDDAGPAPTATAERGRIERIVVASGTIEPEREVEVRPRIPGIVEAIHVKAGQRVAPDQPLVEIERRLLASQVQEAEAAGAAVESVSELTRRIKRVLEGAVPPCWVRGEVSNLRAQASGHIYFSLKDAGMCILYISHRLGEVNQLADRVVALRDGRNAGELARHEVLLRPYKLANELVSNGEFLRFMHDGGYDRPEYWLSDGWDARHQQGGAVRCPPVPAEPVHLLGGGELRDAPAHLGVVLADQHARARRVVHLDDVELPPVDPGDPLSGGIGARIDDGAGHGHHEEVDPCGRYEPRDSRS